MKRSLVAFVACVACAHSQPETVLPARAFESVANDCRLLADLVREQREIEAILVLLDQARLETDGIRCTWISSLSNSRTVLLDLGERKVSGVQGTIVGLHFAADRPKPIGEDDVRKVRGALERAEIFTRPGDRTGCAKGDLLIQADPAFLLVDWYLQGQRGFVRQWIDSREQRGIAAQAACGRLFGLVGIEFLFDETGNARTMKAP
jgi:hypothetical protein